jgi:hypothetical protein
MKPTVFLRTLSATALVAITAQRAAAQATPAVAQQSAPASQAVAPTPWPERPLGRYEIEITLPDKTVPVVVVIADSSGVPAAVGQPDGDPEAHPMKITIKGTELYLNAKAEHGDVELVLMRTGDLISGRWTMGEGKGVLKGRVSK